MSIVVVGIDLAKSVFALNGVNEVGKPELKRPRVTRAKLNEVVAALPPCTIGMEAAAKRRSLFDVRSMEGLAVTVRSAAV